MPIKHVCAWCGMEIGDAAANPPDSHEISHGICPSCCENQMKEVNAARNILPYQA